MIIIPAIVFGALVGVLMARGRGGRTIDMVHHAAVMGIIFGVVGVLVTIVIMRFG